MVNRGVAVGVMLLALALLSATAVASSWRGESVDWTDVDGVDRTRLYPAPGGDPQANLRLGALEGKLIGANGDFIQSRSTAPADSWAPAVLGKLGQAGLNSARRIVSWTTHEPRRDEWDESEWARTHGFYDAARAQKMTPVLVLSFSPYWASAACPRPGVLNPSPECNRPPDDTDDLNAQWAQFALEAAKRFPKAAFEIWNEPNDAQFWGSSINPERWAKLAGIASDVIRFAAPGAKVLGCACSGIYGPTKSSGMNVQEFLVRAYRAPNSIEGKLDGLSVHFRPQDYNPFAPLDFGAGSHFAAIIAQVRRAAALGGEAGKPIWLTEVGYWTRDTGNQMHVVTEDEAAIGLAELARVALTTADIEAVFIHRDVDSPDGPSQGAMRQSSFGLLYRGDRAGTRLGSKPAYCRLAAMAGSYERGYIDAAECPRVSAPTTAITKAPPGSNAPDRAEFEFTAGGQGPALFECSLDGAPARRCSSPKSYSGLSAGRHAFSVRAYRADGAQDETPAAWSFHVGPAPDPTTPTTVPTTTTTVPTTTTPSGTTTITTTPSTGSTTTTGSDGEPAPGGTTTTTTVPTFPEPSAPPTGRPRPSHRSCDVIGTPGNDVLRGTKRADRICGLGGHDVIYGRGGNDAIVGGNGHDRIFGGRGRDSILGGRGRDRLKGNRGHDQIWGGRGNDLLNGGPGRDILRGGPGKNTKRD